MKAIRKIIILGAGGTSRDIVCVISEINKFLGNKYQCLGFLDDDKKLWGKNIMGLKILGPINKALDFSDCVFINGVYSLKDYSLNQKVIKKSKIPISRFETIIHPSASIYESSVISNGSLIMNNVTIMSNVNIGKHVIIQPNTVISHNSEIDDYTFVSNSVSIGGHVKIGKACLIGLNSSIREQIRIGEHSIVGMGGVVLEDIPAKSVYVGNPAKFLKKTSL